MSKKQIIFHSFLLAFILSFFTIIFMVPETKNIIYTNINSWTINVSWSFLVKVFAILLWQTSVLGSVFYVIAKKMFN